MITCQFWDWEEKNCTSSVPKKYKVKTNFTPTRKRSRKKSRVTRTSTIRVSESLLPALTIVSRTSKRSISLLRWEKAASRHIKGTKEDRLQRRVNQNRVLTGWDTCSASVPQISHRAATDGSRRGGQSRAPAATWYRYLVPQDWYELQLGGREQQVSQCLKSPLCSVFLLCFVVVCGRFFCCRCPVKQQQQQQQLFWLLLVFPTLFLLSLSVSPPGGSITTAPMADWLSHNRLANRDLGSLSPPFFFCLF